MPAGGMQSSWSCQGYRKASSLMCSSIAMSHIIFCILVYLGSSHFCGKDISALDLNHHWPYVVQDLLTVEWQELLMIIMLMLSSLSHVALKWVIECMHSCSHNMKFYLTAVFYSVFTKDEELLNWRKTMALEFIYRSTHQISELADKIVKWWVTMTYYFYVVVFYPSTKKSMFNLAENLSTESLCLNSNLH